MSATAKEYIPNVSDHKNVKNKRKVMNEDECFKPKKFMPIKYFCKAHKK